ncbi:hypothetical protein HK096_010608 [Nowakowskiella sp. JEL0078]|nr:hypothetical protein HK096_010608 [Nowakowskiella sp. JEL0078]
METFGGDAWDAFARLFSALEFSTSHPFSTLWISNLVNISLSDPLTASFACAISVILLCYLLQIITDNYSWVDRIWSIVPFVFTWVIAFYPVSGRIIVFENPRLLAIVILATLWGIRLTYNFARKDGYNFSTEDYRWAWAKVNIPFLGHPVIWHVFSLVFICGYQITLLWLISAPTTYVVWKAIAKSELPKWTALDTLSSILFLILLAGETICDNQQFYFQEKKWSLIQNELEKRSLKVKIGNASTSKVEIDKSILKDILSKLPEEYKYGFATSGVFRFSRHLNFFCEQSIWWALYMFTVATTWDKKAEFTHLNFETSQLTIRGFGSVVLVSWALFGPVLLSLLFHATTIITEFISAKKYPMYKLYQQNTSRLVPWFPGTSLNELVKATSI